MIKLKTVAVLDSLLNPVDFFQLSEIIKNAIEKKKRIIITYANINTINRLYRNKELQEVFSRFDVIHHDGFGVYLASKILYGRSGIKNRFTGSDFYPELINDSIKHGWRLFFFGDKPETLSKISIKNPQLKTAGMVEGYNYNDESVKNKINSSAADILVVGLSSPKQEKWIIEHKEELAPNIIIAVGDGIKVFAGNKIRGHSFLQKTGLEWMARLVSNPRLYWKRYLWGIPLFIVRIIKYKLILLVKN